MPLERHIAAFGEEVEVLATLDVGNMWDRLLGEFLNHWLPLDQAGVSETEMAAEMKSFMDGLSTKPEEDVARQSAGVAYNQGRSAEILSAAEDRGVEWVVRSEILDENTCEMCALLDGKDAQVGSADYKDLMPPRYCEGGRRCRGFYVAIGPGGEN